MVLLQRATSCSSNFPVTNHSVVVMGEGGGEVGRVLAEPSSDPLVVTVAGLPLDARLEVAVEACNELFCRTSSTLQLCELWGRGDSKPYTQHIYSAIHAQFWVQRNACMFLIHYAQ